VALRVALDEERRGGFNTSGADARHDFGARLSLLVDRTPQFSAHLWSQWAEKDGHPADLVNKGTDPASFAYLENAFLRTNPWDDTRTGALAALAPFGQPQAETQRYRMFMSGGELAWQLGALKLTWLPSYFYLDSAPDYWLGGIRARLTAHYNQIAQELRLASDPTNRLSWMTGLYLYRVRNGGALSLFTNQPFAFRQSSIAFNELQNAALFAQATLHLPERSRLVAGARDSLDWRKAHGFAPDPVGSGAFNFDREYRHVDWKLGLEHDTAGGALLYASVQTGYKPGSYNEVPASATFDNAVKPSNLLAWSAGWKARYFGDALQLDGEAFYYAYKDLAIQAYDINAPFNPVFNAQKITIPGLQLDSRYRFPDSTRVRLSLGYTHARNRAFTTPAGADFSGLQPPYAPDWTVLGGLDREFPFATGRFRARLDLRYESAWFADYVHNPGVRQHAAAKTDASLTWESRAGWTLGAWVKNLSNEAVLAATAAAGIPGPATAYLESPRTFGVRATLEF
jgi:iron complex outermembrane recepter protein